ncbi:MAG: DUF3520 domain-containing protein [Acidobacteria bacterium]|nr:MAG: DUF3520 domain-containing protein [Acidobacteriota bacterium]
MRKLDERDVQALLTPDETPVPPADLLARLKADIPDDLELPATGAASPGNRRRQRWALAAMLAAVIGGGLLTARLMRQPPSPAEAYGDGAVASQFGERPAPEGAAPAASPAGAGADAPAEVETDATAEDELASRVAGEARPPAARALTPPPAGRLDPGEVPKPRADVPRPVDAMAAPAPPPQSRSNLATEAPAIAGGERRRGLDATPAPRGEKGESGPPSARDRRRRPARSAVPPVPAEPAPQKKLVGEEKAYAGRRPEQEAPAAAEPQQPQSAFESIVAQGVAGPDDRAAAGGVTEESAKLHVRPEPPMVASPDDLKPPNDAPYDAVYFQDYGTNPFVDVEDDPLSTFGLDADTASYAVVRRFLRDGHLPPPAAVRVEELINYFDYRDPPPERGDFALHAEGAPSPFGEGERYYLLRFNVRARDVDAASRPPADLVFVVDVSGSMRRGNRLGLVKDALHLLVDQLRPDDRLALVAYSSTAWVVEGLTSDHDALRRAIDGLVPMDSTNAEAGLVLGYELALGGRREKAIRRVVLLSDGVANAGNTGAGAILSRVRAAAEQGVELTTVGVGMGNYNDVLLEQLADQGNGRYAYVDTLEEARRVFVEDLSGTLQTIAAEARAQVEWNPEVVARYRLVGYENRDVADRDFRNDAVDAGEIGAGHTVTVLYEIKLQPPALKRRDRVATLRLRYASIARGEMVEEERTVTGADFARSWDEASPALQLTSLVAEFGEILKHSFWAREGDLDDVLRRAQRVSAHFAGDRDVAELVALVAQAARLWPSEQTGE